MGWSLEINTPRCRKKNQKKQFIHRIQYGLTGTTIEQSASVRKKNPVLLQYSEEQESEWANYNADVTAKAHKMDMDNNNTIISIEEQKKTLEYQEKMKVGVEIFPKENIYEDQYMKLFMLRFFKE